MHTFPVVYQTKTKEEFFKQSDEVHKSIVEFYQKFPDEFFLSSGIPDGWSAKKNLKHVIGTNKFFAKWFKLPKLIIKLVGKPDKNQKPIEKLSPTNRPNIKDYGKYEKLSNKEVKNKDQLIQNILSSAEIFKNAINTRSEEELDTLSGMFGGMNLRTFMHFILKHNIHHTNVVRQRLERSLD